MLVQRAVVVPAFGRLQGFLVVSRERRASYQHSIERRFRLDRHAGPCGTCVAVDCVEDRPQKPSAHMNGQPSTAEL